VRLLGGDQPALHPGERGGEDRAARELADQLHALVEGLQQIAEQAGLDQAREDRLAVGAGQQQRRRVADVDPRRRARQQQVRGHRAAGPRRHAARRQPRDGRQQPQLGGHGRQPGPRDVPGHREPQADLDAAALGPAELVDDAAGADEVLGGRVVAGLDEGPPAEGGAREVGSTAGVEPGAGGLLAGADPAGEAVAFGVAEVVEQAVGEQDLAGEADVRDAEQEGGGRVTGGGARVTAGSARATMRRRSWPGRSLRRGGPGPAGSPGWGRVLAYRGDQPKSGLFDGFRG
jgi:hypothetical protein